MELEAALKSVIYLPFINLLDLLFSIWAFSPLSQLMETLTVVVEWLELHSSSKPTVGDHNTLAVWESPSITNSS